MAEERRLFSESWHRVSPQKIRLRPSVKVRKQFFRGQVWYVANDIYGDQFFRFRPESWDFIARLDGTRTVGEIWRSCLDRNKDQAPSQNEVMQMLSELYAGNLIISDFPADVGRLFERQKKRHAREWKARLFGIFFLRIPLWDPDMFLNRTIRFVNPILSIWGALLWILLVGGGLGVVVANWETLFQRTQGVLDPGNLPLLLLAFVIAKLIHEFGHGYAVKRFGGEVHRMGITFLVFTPIPYVDATAAWAFRERWKRVWVGAAGMLVELVIAAIAAFVWAATGPGLLNAWCFNLMVVASVSTILFNINPLLRFDGYYILSDLTDTPNLQPRAAKQIKHWVEERAFGGRHSQSPATGNGEAAWLASFGVSSYCYRVFITFTIIMFVADRYLGLGFIAAVLTVIGLFVIPFYKALKYLVSEPRIERVRSRAWWVTAGTLTILFVGFGLLPAPRHVRAPGVVFVEEAEYVIVGTNGVVESYAGSQNLEEGQPLLRLSNPELGIRRRQFEAEAFRLDAVERELFSSGRAGREVLVERRRLNDYRLAELAREEGSLEIRASKAGRWGGPQRAELSNRWLTKGQTLGEIIPGGGWRFFAVVRQQHAGPLFEQEMKRVEVRFRGNAEVRVPVGSVRLVPGRQERLPSPALGWSAKGPVRTQVDDGSGMLAAEPFFLVMLDIEDVGAPLHHGRVGEARFKLDSEPLFQQGYRWLRQTLQKRFQI
jgi:putative peptide zinc metalloprotease protein